MKAFEALETAARAAIDQIDEDGTASGELQTARDALEAAAEDARTERRQIGERIANMRSAMQQVHDVRPENWDDTDDTAQRVAWLAVAEALETENRLG